MNATSLARCLLLGIGVALTAGPGPLSAQEAAPPSAAPSLETIDLVIDGQRVTVPVVNGSARVPINGVEYSLQIRPAASGEKPSAANADIPAGATSNGKTPAPKTWIDWSSPTTWMLTSLLLVVVGGVLYFWVIEPLRRRRLLVEALKILEVGAAAKLPRAEELLDQALLAGLRKRDIALARFALAYVRAQLGKFEAAATVLADLEASERAPQRETIYLSMWVHSKLDKHEKVEKLYQTHAKLLGDLLDVRLLASIAYLKLARLFWARKDVDGAMHYFEQVRKLGVLVDQIPEHLENHAIVLGVVSLFEGRIEEAAERFQGAIEAARQAQKSSQHGEIGLLLCQWRKEELPDIDQALGAIVAALTPEQESPPQLVAGECTHCGKAYRTHQRAAKRQLRCSSCRKRFPALAQVSDDVQPLEQASDKADLLLSEDDLLLRNVRLWYAMSLLYVWRQKPPREGLSAEELRQLLARLEQVSLVDEGFGDPHLVAGLMQYYCGNEEQREAGRARLERASQTDVHVPEVLQILECENKLAALRSNSLTYFHQLAAEYVYNPEVKAEYRERFKLRMERFRRFRELGELEVRDAAAEVTPSLQDLQNRSQILRNRVANIVHHKLDDGDKDARNSLTTLLGDLSERTKALSSQAKELEQSEHSLLATAGQFLFADEAPETPIPEGAANGKKTV